MTTAAILDVDGTLVDTNYHHAIAWYRALRQHGVIVPVWRVHRHIGMGGDQLVEAVSGEEAERAHGDEIREAEKALYLAMIEEVEPFDGARELIEDLGERADKVVLASSAKADEVDRYLDLLDARELADGWTTAADVDATKPQPDLVRSALEKVDADEGLLIGDTVWDVEAAARAGIPTAAVLTGGFAEAELREAGAAAVFESVGELRTRIDDLPAIGTGPAAGGAE
jgi:HAD superfamily hydrolase (TIGR01509 family)